MEKMLMKLKKKLLLDLQENNGDVESELLYMCEGHHLQDIEEVVEVLIKIMGVLA
jgi:hypothetical protein